MAGEDSSRENVPTLGWLARSSPETWGERARDGGPDHVIADCGSIESHELRLHAILSLPVQAGDTLQELGCGSGRLADLVPDGVIYEGLDWSAGVIETARERRPAARFRQGREHDLTPADWIVASGPFNYLHGWSKEQTAAAIDTMWRVSRRGIAVTLLRVPLEGRIHYSPDEVWKFVMDLDWSQVQIDRSYLPNDVCLRAWRT